MILQLLLSVAIAQVPTAPTSVFELPQKRVPSGAERRDRSPVEAPLTHVNSSHRANSLLPKSRDEEAGNKEFVDRPLSTFVAESPIIAVKPIQEKFPGLIRSTILKARINDSVVAYDGSKDPVRATVTEGPLKGSVLFGYATMDKVTKSAIVAFDTFVPAGSKDTYKFLATIKDQDGVSGVKGILESDYWTYFFTQLALDTVAAAADATTQKTVSSTGRVNVVPGVDSTVRQGIAGGMAKTAERIAERNQAPPEFVRVDGPIYVRVYVMEQPEKLK